LLLSVIIPTHNPHAGRLNRALAALRSQTLPSSQWETLIIDNASSPPLAPSVFREALPSNARLLSEPQLGLTAARRRGFREAHGEFVVMVDDDNVLAPDYLTQVTALFAAHPDIGALGGKSLPDFGQTPPAWTREFDGLIACRDHGDVQQISSGTAPGPSPTAYPPFAPIGAGMALRRAALQPWLDDPSATSLSDRRGAALTSGGDNDIVLTLLRHGWAIAYFPSLSLTHLIPAERLTRAYLARLNRGIAKSWVQVLRKHSASPWTPIRAWTVPLRQMKAWFVHRAWSGPAQYVRWQGACGHFEGRASPAP
jgi:glycosyltransferase involved in cell wall biosynthesis